MVNDCPGIVVRSIRCRDCFVRLGAVGDDARPRRRHGDRSGARDRRLVGRRARSRSGCRRGGALVHSIGSIGVPVGILLLLLLGEVRSWIDSVREYVRVEGSAAGVSNPVTRSLHHSFVAIDARWPIQLLAVAAILAIGAGVLAASFSFARLARRGIRRGLVSDGQRVAAS